MTQLEHNQIRQDQLDLNTIKEYLRIIRKGKDRLEFKEWIEGGIKLRNKMVLAK